MNSQREKKGTTNRPHKIGYLKISDYNSSVKLFSYLFCQWVKEGYKNNKHSSTTDKFVETTITIAPF